MANKSFPLVSTGVNPLHKPKTHLKSSTQGRRNMTAADVRAMKDGIAAELKTGKAKKCDLVKTWAKKMNRSTTWVYQVLRGDIWEYAWRTGASFS